MLSSPICGLTALLAMISLAAAAPAHAARGQVRYVTDGDTFRLTSGERIRIADIDAPETRSGQAKCKRELLRGAAATQRARALLDHKSVTFERTGRSYNRTVARVRLNGRDLGETLITMGIAKPWLRRQPKPDWCS